MIPQGALDLAHGRGRRHRDQPPRHDIADLQLVDQLLRLQDFRGGTAKPTIHPTGPLARAALAGRQPCGKQASTALEHRQVSAQERNAQFFGQIKRLLGRHFATHHQNCDYVGHLGGADHLRIGQSGNEERLRQIIAQGVTHQVRGKPGIDFGRGVDVRRNGASVGERHNFTQAHAVSFLHATRC